MSAARALLLGVAFCSCLFLLHPRSASAQALPDFPTGGTLTQPAHELDRPAIGVPSHSALGSWEAWSLVYRLRSGLLVSNWLAPTPRR